MLVYYQMLRLVYLLDNRSYSETTAAIKPAVVCEGPEFIWLYGQNGNGISDSTGLKYDETLKHMKEAGASIFGINETHADKINAKNNNILEKSRRKMFQTKEGHYCKIVSSSSLAPITSYTKLGGNFMGITGPLVGRISSKIEDTYGWWYGKKANFSVCL